jgi:hypothetical protein
LKHCTSMEAIVYLEQALEAMFQYGGHCLFGTSS